MIESTMMDFPLVLPHILERARHLFDKVEAVSVQLWPSITKLG